MKQKLKRAWKVTQIVTCTGLVLSGVFVANELAGTTGYYLDNAEAKETSEIKKVLDNFTEEEILTYLALEAKESEYVANRMKLAEEMLITDKVAGDLERMQLKVKSGLLFPEDYLGQKADDAEKNRQEELRNQ